MLDIAILAAIGFSLAVAVGVVVWRATSEDLEDKKQWLRERDL